MKLICTGLVCIAGLLDVTLLAPSALAQNWSFDASQLYQGSENVDIAVLEQGGQLPGRYLVDIIMNGKHVDTREMVFHQEKGINGSVKLTSCLSRTQLIRYGIKVGAYPALFPDGDNHKSPQCAVLPAIPQATETFLFNEQQLILSIPQIALQPRIKGLAPQELWEDGVPAILMNYQIQVNHYESSGSTGKMTNNVLFARLTPGGNLGAWRLRNALSWQRQGASGGTWQSAWTYAERGLSGLKSRMTLGDRYTPSDIFNSVPFRGGMIGSDENMVSYNQREFAPVIRGVARTLARIEVKQYGYLIYSDTVAPGPFVLSDLSVDGGSGNLQVTIFETDGKRQEFTVPYTTPAIALREGYIKYNLMTGLYRPSDPTIRKVPLGQMTAMYGLPWGNLTAYGGLQWAENYRSAALGLGMSLGWLGALSADGTYSEGRKQAERRQRGQVWRIRYTRAFDTTQTGLSFSSEHFSPTFTTLAEIQDTYRRGGHTAEGVWRAYQSDRLKSRTTIILSQSLAQWGSLSLSGTQEIYRKRPQNRVELAAAYGSTFRGVSWSLNWMQRKARYRREQEISLWLSIPLSHGTGENRYVTYNLQTGGQGRTQHELGLNGDAFDNRLRWDVREHLTPHSRYENHSDSLMNLGWQGTYGELNTGYSYSKTSRQMNAGLAGGMVIHPHGVTFGQPMGQTVALIEAPGVAGASVGGWPGVRTDFRGYTTVGYIRPYQETIMTLDPSSLPRDAEISQTDIRIVPTTGALIPVRFMPRLGGRAVITLRLPDGRPVPFGAMARLAGENTGNVVSGIVGDAGELYMTGLPGKGVLLVDWGAGRQCKAHYQLAEKRGTAGIYVLNALCR